MAHKGERFHQMPTLWHIGWGYPCRVMRRRRVKDRNGRWRYRWRNYEHDVLTMASARRWSRLQAQGKAIVRRDVQIEIWYQVGFAPVPKRAMWAAPQGKEGTAD